MVTHMRAPLLTAGRAPRLLSRLMHEARDSVPYENVASVLLPDHLHCVWKMGANSDYSRLIAFIKLRFTKAVKDDPEIALLFRGRSGSKTRRGDSAVWQRRFWEHAIRDEEDLNAHIDYIHYNPVKHGLVASPFEWKYSSIHRFLRDGFYPADWAGRKEWPEGIGGE